MLYHLTKSIVRMGIRGFFNKIVILGKEHLEQPVPTIAIVNHPSALIDPLVVATATSRRLHFIAAAEYFGKGLQKKILSEEYNMVPVYRPHMYEGEEFSNDDMFVACFETLARNGCIVVFPEGNSVTEKHIRSLKTGVARIMYGFQKLHPDKKINILPIGLNYSDAHRFQSNVIMNIGQPQHIHMDVSKSEEPDQEEVLKATEKMYEMLKDEVIHHDKSELSELVGSVDKIWGIKIYNALKKGKEKALLAFRKEQKIVSKIENLEAAEIDQLRLKTDSFLQKLQKHRVKPQAFTETDNISFLWLVGMVLGLPVYLYGFLSNIIPYLVSRYLFKNKFLPKITDYGVKNGLTPAFVGTLAYSVGVVTYLIWYLILGLILSLTTLWWVGIVFYLTGYYAGIFSLKYAGKVLQFYRRYQLAFKIKKAKDLSHIKEEYKALISMLRDFAR